jgi:hypothetical protein
VELGFGLVSQWDEETVDLFLDLKLESLEVEVQPILPVFVGFGL